MALYEAAQLLYHSFRSLGLPAEFQVNRLDPEAVNVVLGYHLLPGPDAVRNYACVYYQLEQLPGSGNWLKPAYLDILRGALEVWDYSPENVAALAAQGVTNVRLLPLGFHENLATIAPADKDVDVLFYGSLNDRRRVLLNELASKCRVRHLYGVYGEERDRAIARAHIVLNVHFYPAQIMEQARISYLLNNGCFVVSEESPANPYEDCLATAPYDELAACCLHYLRHPEERARIAREGKERFSRRPMVDYVREVLATPEAFRKTRRSAPPRPGLPPGVVGRPGKAPTQAIRSEALKMLRQQQVPARTVLELGGSTGETGMVLCQDLAAERYVGIEASEEAARGARAHLGEVLVADLARTGPATLGLPEAGFDLLVALGALERLPDPREVLAGLVRLLAPGAFAIFSFCNARNVFVLADLASGRWLGAEAAPVRFFTWETIQQLLAGVGLAAVQTISFLRPALDIAQRPETGNVLQEGCLRLEGLSRGDLLHLCTDQYLVLARRPQDRG
jgi:SAM-dependent methyltransferase